LKGNPLDKQFKNPQARVSYYENKMRHCRKVLVRLAAAQRDFEAIRGDMAELERYYTSPEWKRDFALDESGAFPDDLLRGVLSEDGLDTLLELYQALDPQKKRGEA